MSRWEFRDDCHGKDKLRVVRLDPVVVLARWGMSLYQYYDRQIARSDIGRGILR